MFSHNWVKIRSHQVTTEEKMLRYKERNCVRALLVKGGKQFQSSSDVKGKVDVS